MIPVLSLFMYKMDLRPHNLLLYLEVLITNTSNLIGSDKEVVSYIVLLFIMKLIIITNGKLDSKVYLWIIPMLLWIMLRLILVIKKFNYFLIGATIVFWELWDYKILKEFLSMWLIDYLPWNFRLRDKYWVWKANTILLVMEIHANYWLNTIVKLIWINMMYI